jgi:ubiquinone biosynthesis protein
MLRLPQVIYVVVKYGLDEYLTRYERTRFLSSAGTFLKTMFNIKKPNGTVGYRLRLALEELGPAFIKFGQILSTRRDLLSDDMATELSNLKDKVKPFPTETAISIIETELGKPINTIFAHFSNEPIAAASVAQVHLARLLNGEEVAVKILRPGIEDVIKEDLNMFKYMISTMNFVKSNLKGLNFRGIVEELEVSILQELNLKLEAANADQFRTNMQDFAFVKIPKIYHELSTSKIMTMERMYGTPIDNVNELTAQGIDLPAVAQQGLELLIVQIFRNRFFHADQHSGNVWIDKDSNRIYLDFGIMGTLTKEDRDIAGQLMFALFLQNYNQFVDIQIKAGWVPEDADIASLKKYYQSIGSMIVNKSQKDAALSAAFQRLLTVGEKFGINVPVQFTLLVKTLIAIEGIAKTIDPNMNIQQAAKPLLMKHFSKYIKAK